MILIFLFCFLYSALPSDPPSAVTDLAAVLTPTSLSVNYTAVGVLLQWLLPPAQSPLITAFMLQARQEKGEWVTLDREIKVNATEILVRGLTRVRFHMTYSKMYRTLRLRNELLLNFPTTGLLL